MISLIRLSVMFLVLVCCSQALAQQTIRGSAQASQISATPIAIIPFKSLSGEPLAHQIDQIVGNDLYATGKFSPMDSERFLTLPSRREEIRAKDWRLINAEIVVFGEVWKLENDRFEVNFGAHDIVRDQPLLELKRIANLREKDLRTVAHVVADEVYRAATGGGAAFQSHIAYVHRERVDNQRYRYRLMRADWDGYNPIELWASWNPILSPDWSPDAKKLAFVNLTNRGPVVKVLDLPTGRVEDIANFKGVNTAPAWSPDGTKLAYSSSRFGSPDVFIYDTVTKEHQRINEHYAIDTEPSWGPRSETLLFTSSRSRKPQIYRYSLLDGSVTRMTFEGDENANASYDPNGKNIVMVHDGGNIVLMDAESSELMWLTKAKFDESPSFSPNGDMVLYMTEQGFEPTMIVASTDGRVRTRVEFVQGDVREPAWSPLRR